MLSSLLAIPCLPLCGVVGWASALLSSEGELSIVDGVAIVLCADKPWNVIGNRQNYNFTRSNTYSIGDRNSLHRNDLTYFTYDSQQV